MPELKPLIDSTFNGQLVETGMDYREACVTGVTISAIKQALRRMTVREMERNNETI